MKLLDFVEEGICVVQDDALLYANQPLLNLLGYASLAELSARRVAAIADAVDYAAWLEAASAEGTHAQRWSRVDGTIAHVDVSMAALRFADESARMFHVRDATAAERVRRSDRLALIASLSAGIAHQLNNPLAYVLANLNFLAEEIPPFLKESAPSFDMKQHELLTDMLGAMSDAREGAERIARVVRSLRECTRAEDERRDLVDVRVLLDATCATAEADLGAHGRVTKQYESVALVEANGPRLAQAFAAVLRNAVQSRTEGAPLDITVRTYHDALEGTVVIEISDTGCGMGPSVQAHILRSVLFAQANRRSDRGSASR